MPCIQCDFCKKTSVQSLEIDVCTRCLQLGNDAIKIYAIKKYLELNPDAKYTEVLKALNINKETLDRFIQEKSVELINPPSVNKRHEEGHKKVQNLRKQLSYTPNYSRPSGNIERNYGRSQLVIDLDEKKNQFEEETR